MKIKNYKLFLESKSDIFDIEVRFFNRPFHILLESVDNIRVYKNWTIKYNNTIHHDLNSKLVDRSLIKNTDDFAEVVKRIIDRCILNKLAGDILLTSSHQPVPNLVAIKSSLMLIKMNY